MAPFMGGPTPKGERPTFVTPIGELTMQPQDKPTDVTDAMIEAGAKAYYKADAEEPLTVGVGRRIAERIYRAMDAANPIERFDITDLYAEAYRDGMNASRPPVQTDGLDRYDAGLLGNGGGGDVDWWQDYIRAELERAHEYYSDQHEALQRSNAEKDEALRRIKEGALGSMSYATIRNVADKALSHSSETSK